MFKLGDRVRVVTGLEVDKKYGIIECSKDHVDAHGMEGEIIEVFGDGVGYQVSFDPSLTFDEGMLELMESAKPIKQNQQKQKQETKEVQAISKREIVSSRLKKYAEMIDKLEKVDRDMFFGMIYDKLESILFEEYGE